MSLRLSSSSAALILLTLLPPVQKPGQPRLPTAPETFRAQANAASKEGAAAASYVDIHIDQYTRDTDREKMTQALKTGGYPALLTAVRNAPPVGTVTIGKETYTIRWAREQRSGENKRTISVVTDKPMYFLGGGSVNAKPREGYELAVLQFDMDDAGTGQGTMAAAARIKPGGPNGFVIDDYADQPIKLVSISRSLTDVKSGKR
jgi:hypothetical protein